MKDKEIFRRPGSLGFHLVLMCRLAYAIMDICAFFSSIANCFNFYVNLTYAL